MVSAESSKENRTAIICLEMRESGISLRQDQELALLWGAISCSV